MKNATQWVGASMLAVIAAAIVPAARAQEATAPPSHPESVSGTRAASCLVKIITEPSVLPLGQGAIDYLMRSSSVYDRAAKETLAMAPKSDRMSVFARILEQAVSEGPPTEQRILLSLQVGLADSIKPAARELLEALVANFRNAVVKACESELQRLDEQVRLTQEEVQYAERHLMKIQQGLVKLSAQDSSSQTLRSRITAITSELQGLQLERASQEAYREAILKRIGEIQKEVERTVHDDSITAELNQIIQRRMVELKNAQRLVEAGQLTPTALAGEEDKLALARIDLARRREELGKTGSAAALERLTSELTTLTLEAEKTQARERQLSLQLADMRRLLDRAGEYEQEMIRLDVARQNLKDAEILNHRATQQRRMFQMPSVAIIAD